MSDGYILEVRNISKSFPGVIALDNVNFGLKKGEIHALVGENGAGKSTLIKILCGVYREDSGTILLDGKQIKINDVNSARKRGITFVPQEIELMEFLNVSENVYVGKYPSRFGFIDWREVREKTNEVKRLFGGVIAGLNNETLAGDLSIADKQLLEILKVLILDMRIVCLDEPTSSLTKDESDRLFKLLVELKKKGVSIIYVSHRLEEVFQIADRVTVFKDGKYVMTSNIKDTTKDKIINSMVGRDLSFLKKIDRTEYISDENALEVEKLSLNGKFNDISFNLKKGEILGWFGLIGSGRSEVAEAVFGIDKVDSGKIKVFGKEVDINSPKKAINNKVGLAPEDRYTQGLILSMDVMSNVNMSIYNLISKFGFINKAKEKNKTEKFVKDLTIKTPSINTIVDSLSGGNKQKVSIAKWLNANSEVLVFDEPTKGIDVGSKNEIYKLIRDLADSGKSIIFVSSELPEILNLSDRILVFKDGKVTKELINSEEIKEYDILKYAIGN
ncbi:MAG: sugar ABC transporter ATP-binding protein [Actinobacteria bacterium]|nr:sugar ABC transporter ATP-binding protein [Actinomycetota bacterium]